MAWADGDECEPHELAWCAVCKPAPKVKAPPAYAPNAARGGRFRGVDSLRVLAAFDTECVGCGDGIVAGVDYIKRDDDGDWVHEEC